MRSRRVLSSALIAGLTYAQARRMKPGLIMDLYLYRQDYDFALHGLRRKKAGE